MVLRKERRGNVTIEGSIKPGFKVKAEGNVVVGASIEGGAEVTASGNVAVQYGITGSQTRVSAAGSVYAMFVNAARVSTAEDLNISKYIYNASIRAEESIVGHGTRKQTSGGVIAGGIVLAGSQIRAHDIGSDSSSSTQLIAGVDGPLLKRLAQLQKLLDLYRSSITKTLRSLHAEELAPEQIRHFLINMLLKAKGPMRKLIAKSTRNLLQVQARLEKAEKEKRSVEEELTLWLQKIGSFNGTDCHIVTCGASEDRVSMLLTETRSNPLQEDTASEVQQTSCFGPFSQAP